ncbi:MAG: DNA methyltransferase [Byssovorax sp.]
MIDHVLRGTSRWHLEQGNALEILKLLPDASVDAVIADPPYSSGGQTHAARAQSPSSKYVQSGTKRQLPDFDGDNRDQRSFGYWCSLWLQECLRVTKPGAPIALFTDWRQLPTTTDALQAGGWIWRGIVPWDKSANVRPQRGRFANGAEYVVWGSNGPMPANRGVGCLPGLVRGGVNHRLKLHIAGKPPEVMQQLVQICEPGGVVLDLFAGSASTGVACLREGYRFLGIELTPVYAHIARKRMVDAEVELATDKPRKRRPAELAATA